MLLLVVIVQLIWENSQSKFLIIISTNDTHILVTVVVYFQEDTNITTDVLVTSQSNKDIIISYPYNINKEILGHVLELHQKWYKYKSYQPK